MSDKAYSNLLHLTEEQALTIVQALQASGTQRPDERRQHARLAFHHEALLLCELKARGPKSKPFVGKCIDISAGGIGFLHGAFIHVGTPCTITLIGRSKKGFRIEGTVARCQHYDRHIHVIGVKFDQPMEPAQIEQLKRDAALATQTAA